MGLKNLGDLIFGGRIANDNYEDPYEEMDDEFAGTEAPVSNVRTSENTYNQRTAGVSVGSSIEMKVVTPKSYDSVSQIADLLLSKKTVLLNLESTNRETARRLIDFLSGVAYALGGDVQKVADNTYAITPSNVAVSKENIGAAQVSAQPAQETEDDGAAL